MRASTISENEFPLPSRIQNTGTQFSIGVCASEWSANLVDLLQFIRTESLPSGYTLSRIILVASACSKETLEEVRNLSRKDDRLVLIEESKREGKAEALNKIFERHEGEFLLLINADALPSRGSISKLLAMISSDPSIGIASARPFFESKKGITQGVEELMWAVHNDSSHILNHMNISNHSNDEMMIVRSSLLAPLPIGLVNDGAFISARAKKELYSIKFCDNAGVRIEVPSTISNSIGQRRRIIFGHFQVWKLVGKSPITMESMLLFSPFLSFKILARTLARSPRFLAVLPIAGFCELLSLALALKDVLKSADHHGIWKRYER